MQQTSPHDTLQGAANWQYDPTIMSDLFPKFYNDSGNRFMQSR